MGCHRARVRYGSWHRIYSIKRRAAFQGCPSFLPALPHLAQTRHALPDPATPALPCPTALCRANRTGPCRDLPALPCLTCRLLVTKSVVHLRQGHVIQANTGAFAIDDFNANAFKRCAKELHVRVHEPGFTGLKVSNRTLGYARQCRELVLRDVEQATCSTALSG